MKKLYVRIIVGAVALLLALIFCTGSIDNCVPRGIQFTSYVNLKESNDSIYQGLYFSQTKGIFYSVYGKFYLNENNTHIESIELKAVNYSRTLPFTFTIGFEDCNLSQNALRRSNDTLFLDLHMDRWWFNNEEASLHLESPIPINGLKEFNIQRSYNGKFINEVKNDTCEKFDINGKPIAAVGYNCIESKLKILP